MRIRFIRAGIISIVATVVLAVITLAIIGTSAFGDSADLSYRTLDYDVTATANGDLKVTQHIDVKMRERTDSDDNTKPWKQLFQQYTLNSGTLTDISDISVRNVTDGIDYGYAEELKAAYGDKLRPMNAYEGSAPAAFENRIDPDGLRMLLFTSGTTGRSKGVMLSEKNYFTAIKMYIDGQKVMPEVAPKEMDQLFSHFTLVPMFHLSGFICYFAYGIQGWTLNLCADPRDMRRDMSMMHSDAMSTPPVLVEMIYNEIRRGNQEKLNGLWNLSCSSAILDPQILRYLVEHGIYINQCYSMTELAGYGLLNVVQEGEHLRALGKPDGFCEVKLDETGEICVRGGAVMLGYYKDPEATAEAIDKDGWLHSGDLARVDEEGFYYITGRKKNLIILASGENVSPEELEKLLGKCADIKECIVKEMGKKIGAVICCEPEKEQAVRTFVTELNRTLPLYKRISAVECTAEPLPRNALGKLLRR